MARTNVPGRATVAALGEFGLIDRIRGMLPPGDAALVLGVGDDTAAFRPAPGTLLLATCDIQMEGRHFRRQHITAEQLGRRAAAINISDIAAMGGRPRYALVSLALPQETDVEWVDGLYRGLNGELGRFGAAIVGGNLSSSREEAVVDVTLLGEVAESRLLRRDGARPGDAVLVTGRLGESILGRLALERGLDRTHSSVAATVEAHLTPSPRPAEGQAIGRSGLATAVIDVSDGLASDMRHICEGSGVGARVDARLAPVSPEAREVAAMLGVDVLDAALHGGEDYELIVTCAEGDAGALARRVREETGTPVARIGAVTEGEGMTLALDDGSERALEPLGWDHFVSR